MVENIRVEENLPRTGQLPLLKSMRVLKKKVNEYTLKARELGLPGEVIEELQKLKKALPCREIITPMDAEQRRALLENALGVQQKIVAKLVEAEVFILNIEGAIHPWEDR